MTKLIECCKSIGVDYGDLIRRLSDEKLIIRLFGMLIEDTAMDALGKAIEANDYEAAYAGAHTLKGIFMNLGMVRLARQSSAICEAVHTRSTGEIPALYRSLYEDYTITCDAVRLMLDKREGGLDK
ncbi:MAG: Hpt domain-containing protein [Clostridia bacterium]|nr:Hpt domain-containing protein [Clostridia bacterium]